MEIKQENQHQVSLFNKPEVHHSVGKRASHWWAAGTQYRKSKI